MPVNDDHSRIGHFRYYLPTAKDYNVMIDGENFFDQPIKSYIKTYENIWKIASDQGDNYTTSCLLDYNYFGNYYKMIAIDLSKQQALDADPKAIQQINFTGNIDGDNNRLIFLIIEEVKETFLNISQGAVKVFWMCSTILFCSNIISI